MAASLSDASFWLTVRFTPELDDTSSSAPVVSGPFGTREEALDDLWDNRDDANQGSEIFE